MQHKSDMTEQLRRSISAVESRSCGNLSQTQDFSFSRSDSTSQTQPGEADDGDVDRAYQKVLRSACACEQSSERMRGKLVRAGFSSDVIDSALERAVRAGVIDDRRYAESLVRSTIAAGKGLSFASKEVESLGIAIEELRAYQDYLDDEGQDEIERAVAVIRAHPPRAKNKRDAAYRRCVSKGFSSDVASSAARLWLESLDAQEAP